MSSWASEQLPPLGAELLEQLALPADTPVIEWHRPTRELRAAGYTSGYDNPVAIPTETTPGALLLLMVMAPTDVTGGTLNGWTLHAQTGTVTGGGVWDYRLAILSTTAPASGSVTAPVLPTHEANAPWVCAAFPDAEAFTAVTTATQEGGTSATAPAPVDTSGELLRVWAICDAFDSGAPNPIITPAAGTVVAGDNDNVMINIVAATGAGAGAAAASNVRDVGWATATLTVRRTTAAGVETWHRDDDLTAALLSYTATHGRRTATEATEPLTATVQLARAKITGQLPAAGDRFRLTVSDAVAEALELPEAARPRFTGEVTDVQLPAGGVWSVLQLAATGRSARLARTPVTLDRPGEKDGARVRRILYAARLRLPLQLGDLDTGTVRLLPLKVTGASAGELLATTVTDAAGQLVEQRSGRLDYHNAEHRRGATPTAALAGGPELIQPFTWAQGIGTVVNDAVVTYGTDRKTVRVRDAAAQADLGVYGVQLDTQLEDRADAWAHGSALVGRYSRPLWMLPEVRVDLLRSVDPATAAAVLGLSHGDQLTVDQLPPDGPFTAGDLFVEGTTESCDRTTWQLTLAVSDPRLSGTGLRWLDADPALRWLDADPALRWLDAATMTDPAELGTIAAPVASFTTSPTSGTSPLAVTVTNTSTGVVTTWGWDFGDGTSSTAQTPPAHTYTAAGSYTITLTATGPGGTSTATSTVTVAAPAPSYSSQVLADTPLLYWRLGETSGTTAADASGNGRTGTYGNSPTLGVPGLLSTSTDKAVQFTADSGQYVQIPSAAWMNVATLTAECLVKFTAAPTADPNGDAIVGRATSAGWDWLLWRKPSGVLEAQLSGASGATWSLTSTFTPVVGTRYHIAFTYDGTTMRLYVDGAEVATLGGRTGGIWTGGSQLAVGMYSGAAVTTPPAVIDEVAVYGAALSAARIAAHYAAT